MTAKERAARFWDKVLIDDDRCWPWTRATNKCGYGWVLFGDRPHLAHRVAWALVHRRTIPVGQCVLHRCDNPPCCNPDHLFLGTQLENIADRHRKHRDARGASVSIQGERHGMSKLTTPQVLEIRRLYDARMSRDVLSLRFNVTPDNTSLIGRRKTWRHLPEEIVT